MADIIESACATSENSDFFQTALEDCFPDLSLAAEVKEISRITNEVLTPRSTDIDPVDDNLHMTLPQECANEYFQSSTPKRGQAVWKSGHLYGRLPAQPKLLIRLGDFVDAIKPNDASEANDGSDNCYSQHKSSLICPASRQEISAPRFSVVVREHRRQLILSPFSQKLQNVILRKESARKRVRRTEMSKKAQRASLRV